MCGICGWISFLSSRDTGDGHLVQKCLENRLKIVNSLVQTLLPRGPDEQGIWNSEDECCILGHTRLIVVDPEGGKQPMTACDRNGVSYTITYNGELYNTNELRNELISKGHSFKSYSDTEVLLHAYMEWNTDCLVRLEGIFAFGIWSKGQLFFARDRLGVKPFFYSVFPQNFIFASEMKALLEHPLVSRDVPSAALATLFAVGYIRPVGFVPFKDIQELLPGFAGTFSENGLELWKYWDLDPSFPQDSVEEASVKIHSLLKNAVCRQTFADVPFGTLLSGGIDSTALMHFVYEKFLADGGKPKLQTFSLGLPEYSRYFQPTQNRPDNDEDFIRICCSKYEINHTWVAESSEEIVSAVEGATMAKDYPIMGDLDLTLFLLFKKVKPDVTVLLSGEGADEIFGGYRHYYFDDWVPGIPMFSTAISYGSLLKDEVKSQLNLEAKVVELYQKTVEMYQNTVSIVPAFEKMSPDEMEFQKRTYFHIKFWLPFMLERKDHMSMSSGVEVRVPFTDHNLVQYAFQIPKSYKMDDGVEKHIFRKSMKNEENFPKEIRTRTKSPYPTSINNLTVQLSRKLLGTIFEHPEQEPIFKWFDYNKLKTEFHNDFQHFNEKFSLGFQLWTYVNLYSLNFWFKHNKVNVVY